MNPQPTASLPPEESHDEPTSAAGGFLRKYRLPLIVGAGVLVLGVGGFALMSSGKKEHAPASPLSMTVDGQAIMLADNAPQWRYVEVAAAKLGPAIAPLPAPGRVEFDEKQTANLSSPLSGRVETVSVRLGDPVKKNQRLFSVRSGDFAEVAKDVASARSEAEVKRRVAERARELLTLQATSEKEVLIAEAEANQANLAMRAARARKGSLEVDSGSDNLFWVKSPRDGTVVALDVYASQAVSPDRATPLVQVSDLEAVRVVADVTEADARDLSTGMKVNIRNSTDEEAIPAVIEHVSQVVDPRRRTVEVRILADNKTARLRPNAFVEVGLSPKDGVQRIRVPDEAVVSLGADTFVFVERGNARLERVKVQRGRSRDGEVELRSGLEPGDRFVAKGALLLLNQIELAE